MTYFLGKFIPIAAALAAILILGALTTRDEKDFAIMVICLSVIVACVIGFVG